MLIAFACNSFAETSEYTNEAYKLFEEGENLLQDNNKEDALLKYQELLATYPNSSIAPIALIRAGNIYNFNKDYNKAIESYNKIIDIYPDTVVAAQAMLNIGSIYNKSNDLIKAKSTYENIIEKYANSTDTSILAIVAQAEKRSDNMLKLQETIENHINRRESLINSIKAHKTNSDTQSDAILIENYIILSDLYAMKNDKKQAIEYLKQGLEEYPINKHKEEYEKRIKRLQR